MFDTSSLRLVIETAKLKKKSALLCDLLRASDANSPLGSAQQVAAAGTATCGTIAAVGNTHGYFRPANPTPAILRQELFPERYPQIPLPVFGATGGGRERRGQKQTQRSKAASVSVTTGEKGNAQRTHQRVLAVLWGAIREVSWLGVV